MKNKKQATPSVSRMKQQGTRQHAREIPESSKQLLFLKDAQKEDFGVMGGKAASLAKMISYGIPVPEAFVVTTNLFGAIDDDAQACILKHFDRLGATYVSVRSSATVEDSSDLSFAGQFDTFLNVTKKDLLRRIRECQRSADNPRVREYCRRNNVERSAVKVAVIVQRMIDSEYSGVLFTVNPLNHDPSSMIIEAVAGLGEALVSGIVTPSTYAVNKRQGRIVSRTYGTQRRKLVRAPNGGNIWKPLRVAGGEHLSSPRIRKLCKLALRVEKYFKVPVDIEWAIERGRIYILQSRPITTRA
jgi:pyruvate,water dikinase